MYSRFLIVLDFGAMVGLLYIFKFQAFYGCIPDVLTEYSLVVSSLYSKVSLKTVGLKLKFGCILIHFSLLILIHLTPFQKPRCYLTEFF